MKPEPTTCIRFSLHPSGVLEGVVSMSASSEQQLLVELQDAATVTADVLVIPTTTAGTFGEPWHAIVAEQGLPGRTSPIELGGVRVVPAHGKNQRIRYLAFAATVQLGQPTLPQIIASIGAHLGNLSADSRYPDISTVATPVLGTGVGGLDPAKSLQALVAGYAGTAAPSGQLRIIESDLDRFDLLSAAASNVTGGQQPELPRNDPPLASSVHPVLRTDTPLVADEVVTSAQVTDSPEIPTESGPVSILAEPSADSVPDRDVARQDRLNLGREIDMLASVMLASNTPLPLAIGLFGEWGSGKSFFMRMLDERIGQLAQSRPALGDDQPVFCRHIRQVHFNAWHYIDGNLWASLASTIFDGLVDRPDSAVQEEKQDQLGEATKLAVAASEARVDAERSLRVEQQRVGRLSTIVGSAVPAALAALRESADLQVQLDAEGEPLSESANQFVAAADAARSAGRQGALVRGLLRTELASVRRRSTVIWLTVAVGLMVGVSSWALWRFGQTFWWVFQSC